MKDSTTISPPTSVALLLVGSPGTGKTTLALQFPAPYIFDADGNLAGPLRHLGNKFPFKYDTGNVDDNGVEVPPFDRFRRFATCIGAAATDPSIRTIIVDSLTTLRDYVRDDILRQRGVNPNVKNAPVITEANRAFGTLILQEWETYAFYFRNMVSKLRTSNKHVIFTAHQETIKDEADGIFRTFLAIQGQTRASFAGLFSDVWNPYVSATGFGDAATHTRMVRTISASSTDERGLKSSLQLPNTWPASDLRKLCPSLWD